MDQVTPVRGAMTERELRQSLVHAAREFGWRVYFSWTSIHSPAGFPDLCMIRGTRLVFAELKTDKGKVSEDQEYWLNALRALHDVEVYVWRPADLEAAYRVLMP